MKKAVKLQISFLLRRPGCKLVFWFVFLLVAYHYVSNVLMYQGSDVTNMYHPMSILLMTSQNDENSLLIQLLPFLVVIPAGFSVIDDKNSGEIIYIRQRITSFQYYFSKGIAVFVVTFLTFFIPLFLEIILNCIAFPLGSSGSPSNFSIYEPGYVISVGHYFLSSVFIETPYLHAIIMTAAFAFFCAVFGLFSAAVSTLGFKLKVFVFLPAYVFLYMTAYIRYFINVSFYTSYSYYLYFHLGTPYLNWKCYYMLLILLIAVSVLLLFRASRKDCLS